MGRHGTRRPAKPRGNLRLNLIMALVWALLIAGIVAGFLAGSPAETQECTRVGATSLYCTR